jgi:hypothetical protein
LLIALVATQLRRGIESPTGERDAVALAPRVDGLLAQSLTLERAVSVALLNNPRLLAEYAQLGVSRGDLIAASRLPNPCFGWKRERAHPHRQPVDARTSHPHARPAPLGHWRRWRPLPA